MLVRPIFHRLDDPILSLIAEIKGNSLEIEELTWGVYIIGHFNGDTIIEGIQNAYPDLPEAIEPYGVCDSLENLVQTCPTIMTDRNRRFVVTLTPVKKANEPPEGGWRWHKWGPYIGKHTPKCEYLYDEPDIDMVYVYHIYEM